MVNGPVKSYTLPPVELAVLRSTPNKQPRNEYGVPLKKPFTFPVRKAVTR
jgi:hypothetical protein